MVKTSAANAALSAQLNKQIERLCGTLDGYLSGPGHPATVARISDLERRQDVFEKWQEKQNALAAATALTLQAIQQAITHSDGLWRELREKWVAPLFVGAILVLLKYWQL